MCVFCVSMRKTCSSHFEYLKNRFPGDSVIRIDITTSNILLWVYLFNKDKALCDLVYRKIVAFARKVQLVLLET